MNRQKGVAHLLLLLIIAVIVGGAILFFTGVIKIPGFSLPSISLFQRKANVELKSEYKNPFKKETQYVNPFQAYKNPFVVAK